MDVEYLIIADGAQVVGGKVYVLGGGWDRLHVPDFPVAIPIGIAFGIRFEWEETNRPHDFSLTIEHEDGDIQLLEADGQVEAGRPPGMVRGAPQVAHMAAGGILQIPKEGSYAVVLRLGGQEKHRVFFHAKKA